MTDGARQRVALVTPFFGRDLRGRKERFAFALATHLALEGVHVEVITTTATSDAPDANFYRAGLDHTEPFPVHRRNVLAPDRVAYESALLAARRGDVLGEDRERALLDERVRSPELFNFVRDNADRYGAFLLCDVTSPTTVHALTDVAERALLVPLLDDEPAARLPAVAAAVLNARMILCTTKAEALLVAELYGAQPLRRTRIIGLGADVVPRENLPPGRLNRLTHGRPYVLAVDCDAAALDRLRESPLQILPLDEIEERDRAAAFAYARAVALCATGLGFVPEVVEAWAYGKPVLVAANAPGAAALVREAGGGIVVEHDAWAAAVAEITADARRAELAAGAAAFIEGHGGWRAVVARVSEAIDSLDALDEDRSTELLLAQVAYLYPLVQRQRRTIDAMRLSRFWRLRDAWFAFKRRFGIGPMIDPVHITDEDARVVELAALGDPYQLFREQHRLRDEDLERMRAVVRFLPLKPSFSLVVDIRGRELHGIDATLRTLRAQLYEGWIARLLIDEPADDALLAALQAASAQDARIVIVPPGEDRFGDADFVGPLGPGDQLESNALFELALALQDGADVAYTDEDRLDDRNVPDDPWFKPDWSPETFLTRDYIGELSVVRRALLESAGGVRDVFESARWYEALLRVTEDTDRVVHVARVLCHRHVDNAVDSRDLALAVEVALRRRGEAATIHVVDGGVDVRFAVDGERVCIIVPTRDRPDLLGPCVTSVFAQTSYQNFEMLVVDNGSRETETQELLASWEAREPQRFHVLRDPAPFNYSRLNNEAVAATSAPFVLLLNNDTEVLAPDWIDALLGQARRPHIGAVGAMLLYPDGTVQHGGVVLGILGLAGHAHRYLPANARGYHGALALDTNYLAVTGACLMVEKRKYQEVGGLDEALAVSYNDVDLCLKLHQRGYRNVFVPRARVRHYESKSRGGDDTPAKVARAMEEVGAIRRRWPVWASRDPYYNPNLTVDAEDFGLRL